MSFITRFQIPDSRFLQKIYFSPQILDFTYLPPPQPFIANIMVIVFLHLTTSFSYLRWSDGEATGLGFGFLW